MTVTEWTPTERRVLLTERLRSRSMTRSMLSGMVASAIVLVLQLGTGVLNARLLGPSGRGEVAAIMAWVVTAAAIGGLGFTAGLSYLQATARWPSPSLLAGSLVSVLVLGTASLAITELLIPIGFGEQSDDVISLARVMMFTIYIVMAANAMRSLVSSNRFFLTFAVLVVSQPLVYAVGALVLWISDSYTVGWVLAVQIAGFGVTALGGVIVLVLVSGLRAADVGETRTAIGYGVRSFGATLSRIANARLDLVVMPAFVGAAQIGLYAVAISVGSMMVALFEQVSRVVLTSTAQAEEDERGRLVERILRIVALGAIAIALFLAVFGPDLISLVYGADFRAAGTSLRLLLPGLVLWTCNMVITGSLMGANRPGRPSIAQALGVVVTVVGLWWSVPRYGAEGAAATSSIAYASVCSVNYIFLRDRFDVSLRRTLSPRALVVDVRGLWRRLLPRLRSSR
ncbi:lipopolysaccharide biosynthesis protein [Ilumatobacter nonamiensis]|uniref:lipopolysaccharide biosynthesis protein n=1 Tax=Ilumatobacter nonamiensis TaxID=467093 RepID=UPI00058AF911|nr:polysaccharide biosynthesis C-terminal domain-containing protein [Ilumatobacter nonamiensis]